MKGYVRRIALLVCVAGIAVLVSSAVAQAALPVTDYFGGHGTGPGQFEEGSGLAVDEASGDVYVFDSYGSRIQRFDEEGNFEAQIGPTSMGTTDFYFGFQLSQIAIDQSGGYLYVPDSGNNRVVKIDLASGAYVDEFGGPGDGDLLGPRGVAVAPDGSVYVADSSNARIAHFSATGTFIDTVGAPGSGEGELFGPTRVAVDGSGRIYALEQASRIVRFAADGSFDEVFAPSLASPLEIAIDLGSDQVYVLANTEVGEEQGIYELDTAGAQVDLHGSPNGVTWYGKGLAVGEAVERLYVTTSTYREPSDQVLAFGLPAEPAPEAEVDPITVFDAHGATATGTVTPKGNLPATYKFEYSPAGEEEWTTVPLEGSDQVSGAAPVAVEATIEGLEADRSYDVRLTAAKAFTIGADSETTTFDTLASAPTVFTQPAGPRASTRVRLNGWLVPENKATTYYFEYGTGAGYGSRIPAADDVVAGSGPGREFVSQWVEGLEPGTEYHARIVASNVEGESLGEDVAFTTEASGSGPPERGIELVNSPDKGNQDPAAGLTADGQHVIWTVVGGAPGATSGTRGAFLASRTAAGWTSRNILPPADQIVGNQDLAYQSPVLSADLSSAIFNAQGGGFTLGAALVRVEGIGTQIHQSVLFEIPGKTGSEAVPVEVTEDLQHVFGATARSFDADDSNGEIDIYDFGDGPANAELVDRMPDGSVPACGAIADGNNGFGIHPYAWTSNDPSVDQIVYFESTGDDCGGPANLYARNLATDTTTLLSGPAESGAELGGYFLRASRDGQTAIFASDTRLDPDGSDENETTDLYRFTFDSGSECITCDVADADVQFETQNDRRVVVSEDLSRIYFFSPNRLTPDALSTRGLYVWHGGGIDYIADTDLNEIPGGVNGSFLSDDGSVLLFKTETQGAGVTSDDNAGATQWYRYDDTDGSLFCISCPPPGATPGELPADSSGSVTPLRWLNEDGSSFVFQTGTQMLPSDINGREDIYIWKAGLLELLTDGETQWGGEKLQLQSMSADESNVLFIAGARLTGFERDNLSQVYVARVGGGFDPPNPPAECVEDACQGPLAPAPRFEDPGSRSLVGPPNPRSGGKKCKKKKTKSGARGSAVRKCKKSGKKRSTGKSRGAKK